jgi:mRNA-degrading endonuclease YafQ of YafQ-DinJ toxin-antitoxin module
MIEMALSSSFKRAFRKQIQTPPRVRERFWERVAWFQENPFDGRLQTPKLSGKLKELWSFSLEYDVRVICYFKATNQVVFTDIGSHDDVY